MRKMRKRAIEKRGAGKRLKSLFRSPKHLQTNDRMGELAEKIQDLEFIVSLMEGLATRFKPTSAVV